MFETHKLNNLGFNEMNEYKETMAHAVIKCIKLMPEGREKSLFKTNIEEAVFWGAKAIASKDGNYSEVFKYE